MVYLHGFFHAGKWVTNSILCAAPLMPLTFRPARRESFDQTKADSFSQSLQLRDSSARSRFSMFDSSLIEHFITQDRKSVV